MGQLRIALEYMFALGASNDEIMEFVGRYEAAHHSGGVPQTPRQERNKRYYENKRLKASETVLIKTPDPSPSSPYDNKNSSTPSNPILTPLPPKTREERAKRLPEDWQPSEGLLSSKPIQKLGLPREVLMFETEAFRDHFLGNGRRMIDWNKAWSNWMREALRRSNRGRGFEKRDGMRVALDKLGGDHGPKLGSLSDFLALSGNDTGSAGIIGPSSLEGTGDSGGEANSFSISKSEQPD
jgi:hypothetical protein